MQINLGEIRQDVEKLLHRAKENGTLEFVDYEGPYHPRIPMTPERAALFADLKKLAQEKNITVSLPKSNP